MCSLLCDSLQQVLKSSVQTQKVHFFIESNPSLHKCPQYYAQAVKMHFSFST